MPPQPRQRSLAFAVAQTLAELARERDLSQSALARLAGLPQSSTSRYLKQGRAMPLDAADRLARALGTDLIDVIRQAREQ